MRCRGNTGSALTEFGPAFVILMLFLFFPLINLLMLGADYCACVNLNQLQAQKAAEVTQAEAITATGPVRGDVVDAWRNSSFGAFMHLEANPVTDVLYIPANGDPSNYYVVVTTKIAFSPFLRIPIFPGVPGLGAPIEISVTSQRFLEDPGHQITKRPK